MGKGWKDRLGGAPDATSFRPTIFDPTRAVDARGLDELLAGAGRPIVHDTLAAQLVELVMSLDPNERNTPEDHARLAHEHLGGRDPREYGRWIHYPWSNRLVHTLPPDEYFFLRSDRNRYRITPAEQRILRGKTIGVVGLSVGQATAITMVMEGVGGRFRIADFDTLGLSNMNRLRTSVCNLGLPKTILLAREMFEIDPFLDVTLFSEGVGDANADRFFTEGGVLDLLVEECDDLYAKVALRERARALRVPVVMETSDRGMLDIERFDLEPHRRVFHGVFGDFPAHRLRGLTSKEKVPFVLQTIDARTISAELGASLVEVKESIYTWPQLASAVTLGGAVATDAARRVLLDRLRASGRFYVDLARIVCDETAATPVPSAALEPTIADEARSAPHIARPASVAQGPITEAEARFLVAHAALAPSGGNAQPWRFVFGDDVCKGWIDTARADSFLDFEHAASTLALGAAAENLSLAARAIGLTSTFEPFPEPDQRALVFRARFVRGAAPEAAAELEGVVRRVTNRRRAARRALAAGQRQALVAAAESRGLRLALLEGDDLDALAPILGKGDRLRFLSPTMHRELMGELRWTPEEVLQTRTGIDIASLDLPLSDQAAMRVLRRADAMAHLRRFDGGKALETPARDALAATSAVGLLTIDASASDPFFHGGRGVEHVWLLANALGLAFQPYTALVYLFRRLERGGAGDFSDEERASLADLRRDYLSLFAGADATHELMLFRLSHADAPPTARALRLPLDAVAKFAVGNARTGDDPR